MIRVGILAILAAACGGQSQKTLGPEDLESQKTLGPEDLALDADPEPTPAAGGKDPRFEDPQVEPPGEDPRSVARRLAAAPARRGIYRGHRVDITFVDMDLHDAFRTLSEIGDVDIVVAGDVRGSISLRLRRVPWDQALETIVKLEGLSLAVDGRIYRITQ